VWAWACPGITGCTPLACDAGPDEGASVGYYDAEDGWPGAGLLQKLSTGAPAQRRRGGLGWRLGAGLLWLVAHGPLGLLMRVMPWHRPAAAAAGGRCQLLASPDDSLASSMSLGSAAAAAPPAAELPSAASHWAISLPLKHQGDFISSPRGGARARAGSPLPLDDVQDDLAQEAGGAAGRQLPAADQMPQTSQF